MISKALEALEELWGNIQAIFNDKQKKLEEKYGKAYLDDSEFREKINKKELNDDKLMIRTCKMIGIYYNLHFAFSSSSPIRTSLVYDKFSTFIANFEVLLYFLIYRSPSLLFASLEFFLFFPKWFVLPSSIYPACPSFLSFPSPLSSFSLLSPFSFLLLSFPHFSISLFNILASASSPLPSPFLKINF